jgi:hypothetical protein
MPHPTFLVVGAAKAGTTSLCHYLRQHPDIFVAREKESHYFAFPGSPPQFTGPGEASEFLPLIITDEQRYLDCFAAAHDERAIGEASVYYSLMPESFARALQMNSDMRFLMILREPLERAHSAWSHQFRDGWETLDFGASLAEETERTARGWGFGWQYRRVGDYVTQLEDIRGTVPPEQLHVMLYDDFVRNPQQAVQGAFRFLGVDDSFLCDTSLVLNASGTPRITGLNYLLSRQNRIKDALKKVVPYRFGVQLAQRLRNWNLSDTPLSSTDRAELGAQFRYDRDKLEMLSGRDLSAWPSYT